MSLMPRQLHASDNQASEVEKLKIHRARLRVWQKPVVEGLGFRV